MLIQTKPLRAKTRTPSLSPPTFSPSFSLFSFALSTQSQPEEARGLLSRMFSKSYSLSLLYRTNCYLFTGSFPTLPGRPVLRRQTVCASPPPSSNRLPFLKSNAGGLQKMGSSSQTENIRMLLGPTMSSQPWGGFIRPELEDNKGHPQVTMQFWNIPTVRSNLTCYI